MGAPPVGVRRIFRASMVIFLITIVIGILNGMDIWDVPRNTLMAHVHAGTLGWISLSVFAGAIWMFGSPDDDSSGSLANFSIVAIAIYVVAFWTVDLTTPDSIQRPIGGALAFVAIAWMFSWAWKRRGASLDVARLGMLLALGFLVIGAILGVLLGLQLADVQVVAPENTDRLYETHPGAMIAGFVILAALSLIEWLMSRHEPPKVSGPGGKLGATQMWLLFVAGSMFVLGPITGVENLLQAGGGLQLLASIVLLVRLGRRLSANEWGGELSNRLVRTAVIGMLIGVGLIFYLVMQLSSGKTFEDIMGVGIALDHTLFIMVITNLVLALMCKAWTLSDGAGRLIYWAVNIGVVGFAIGLISEQAVLKQIFTPIMGLGLIFAIYKFLTASEPASY